MFERILIMTDSSNTISMEDAIQNEIDILPLTLERSDGVVYSDEPDKIKSDQILAMLNDGFTFKTATTVYGVIQQHLEQGLSKYDKIIVCPISRGWSSQTDHIQSIANNYPNRVFVIDTKDYGYSLECLCLELRKMINDGVEFSQVLDYARNHWKYSLSLFACKTLKGLAKSGRLPKIVATALSVTKITPIIKAEYTNQKEGLALGWHNVFEKFLKYTDKYYDNQLNPTNITHMCVLISEPMSEDIAKLKDTLASKYQLDPDHIVLRWAPNIFLCLVWKGAIGMTTIASIPKKILPNEKEWESHSKKK